MHSSCVSPKVAPGYAYICILYICEDQLDSLCVRPLTHPSIHSFVFFFPFSVQRKKGSISLHGNIHVLCVLYFFAFQFLLHVIQYSSTQSLEISLNLYRYISWAKSHEHVSGDYYYYYYLSAQHQISNTNQRLALFFLSIACFSFHISVEKNMNDETRHALRRRMTTLHTDEYIGAQSINKLKLIATHLVDAKERKKLVRKTWERERERADEWQQQKKHSVLLQSNASMSSGVKNKNGPSPITGAEDEPHYLIMSECFVCLCVCVRVCARHNVSRSHRSRRVGGIEMETIHSKYILFFLFFSLFITKFEYKLKI